MLTPSKITIDISEYDYDLPKDRIALYPADPRSSSKLLVVNRADNKFEHRRFAEIVEYFRAGDILVLNDSKVFPARLYGNKKDTAAKWKYSCCVNSKMATGRLWSNPEGVSNPARQSSLPTANFRP
jgi:S-adenosylmethionine:tRNA-ribosyltransferase-isomerase (queuine synthetase)